MAEDKKKEEIAGVSNMFIRGGNLNGKENNRIVQKKI